MALISCQMKVWLQNASTMLGMLSKRDGCSVCSTCTHASAFFVSFLIAHKRHYFRSFSSTFCRVVQSTAIGSILVAIYLYIDQIHRAAMYVNNHVLVNNQPQSHIANIVVNPPYQHVSVNHTTNFVDPQTGACTNMVERFWKNAKKKNKEMCGTSAEMLPGYLDEFQWRQQYGKKTVEAFNNILVQIAHFYPVNNWFSFAY